MDKFVKKFTSGRVHYIVHDWTALSYKDTLKRPSPQMDEFITCGDLKINKVHKGTNLLVHKVDEFIIKWTNRNY